MSSSDGAPDAARGHRLPRSRPVPTADGDTTRVMPQDRSGLAGRRIGRFDVVEKVGEGGMGVVYRAVDSRDGTQVALKVLRPHIAYDSDAQARLAREVATLERVHHPNVAGVIDADPWGERPFIATRFVPGVPLDVVVARSGPLDADRLARLGRELAAAIDAIHAAGVVHRDLKPSNVLMVGDEPVVIDFGIAHIADDARLTSTGLVMGTPGYLSPELVEGAPVSTSTDWWGWAATLAFAAQGEPPFGRGHMATVLDRVTRGQADLSGVDPRLRPLLVAALSPVPQERPSSRQVLEQMERYARGEATTLVPMRGAAVAPTSVLSPGEATRRAPVRPAPATMPAPGADRRPPKQYVRPRPEGATGSVPAAAAGRPVRPQTRPGEHDPRITMPQRSGTLQALFAAWLGLVAVAPVIGFALLVLWNVAARFTDSTITQTVLRRHEAGRRRSDGAVAVASAPWHAARAVLGTLAAVILPLIVFAVVDGLVGIGWATVRHGVPAALWAVPLVTGAAAGQWVLWRGAGSTAYRRGSRSLVRGVTPTATAAKVVVAVLLGVAALCLLGTLGARGSVSWTPLTGGFTDPLAEYLPNTGSVL